MFLRVTCACFSSVLHLCVSSGVRRWPWCSRGCVWPVNAWSHVTLWSLTWWSWRTLWAGSFLWSREAWGHCSGVQVISLSLLSKDIFAYSVRFLMRVPTVGVKYLSFMKEVIASMLYVVFSGSYGGTGRSGIHVEFSALSFYFRSYGDLTADEFDAVCAFLHGRVMAQERTQLYQLKACFKAFRRSDTHTHVSISLFTCCHVSVCNFTCIFRWYLCQLMLIWLDE